MHSSADSATLRQHFPCMEPKDITAQIVDAAVKIHTQMVLNFGLPRMKAGITRIVNGLPEPPVAEPEIT